MRYLLLALLMMILGCQTPSLAAILGPGTYEGQFTTDRWGQQVLHNGVSDLFLSDKVAQQLKVYEGKLLKVEVKKMYQPMNPGGGIIESIGNVVVKKETATSLKINIKTAKVKRGQGATLHLALQNVSKKQIEITPWELTLSIVTNKPFSNSDIGYKDPQDRAYWYYGSSVISKGKPDSWPRIAYREILLPWHPQQYAAQSLGVTVGPQTPTFKDPGTYNPLLIKPNGKLEFDITVGQELLPREYEVFFYLKSDSSDQQQGLISNRVEFDVVGPSPK